MNNFLKNKLLLYLLFLLHGILCLNALVAGFLLIIKSDGSLLKMNPDMLINSPFPNFLLPGLFLFTFLGLLSGLSLCGLVFRFQWKIINKLNLYSEKHWAWAYSLYTGIGTIIWITVQLVLTQYFWLQPVIIFIGIGIIVCTLTPGVMKHYEIKK